MRRIGGIECFDCTDRRVQRLPDDAQRPEHQGATNDERNHCAHVGPQAASPAARAPRVAGGSVWYAGVLIALVRAHGFSLVPLSFFITVTNSSRSWSVSRTIYCLFMGNLCVSHIILGQPGFPNPNL
jgi:hypothetical protein